MANPKYTPLNGQIYKHFKGNYYVVIGHATDSDTNEMIVLYREAEPKHKPKGFIWARTVSSWFKPVDVGSGRTIPRFKLVTLTEYSEAKKASDA